MPERNLNVALIPLDPHSGLIEENLRQVSSKLAQLAPGTDLVVLPEMFSTGFATEQSEIQEAMRAFPATIEHLCREATHYLIAIWGTAIAPGPAERPVNCGFMINPDGAVDYYPKHHLFSLGLEPTLFDAGREQAPIVNFRTWNLKMCICYDLRFPVWNRNRECGYDALIVPANWPESRRYAWEHLLIARAIENQAYVAGCNRLGSDVYGTYSLADTEAFDYRGYPIGHVDSDTDIIYVTFEAEPLIHNRDRFPFWRDADSFLVAGCEK